IKGLLFAFVALFAFTVAMVKVSAAEEEFGTYKVTTTTNTNDTATWDYSATSATKNYATGDILTGGVTLGAMGGKATKGAAGYLDVYTKTTGVAGGVISFPVPAGSAGTATLVAQGNQSTRCLYLNADANKKIASSVSGDSVTFTADDITDGYLVFTAFEEASGKSNTEVKMVSFSIVLTTGEFEATAELVNVTFHDGESVLTVEEVAKGSAPSYVPTKWGYDFAGVYSDAELSTEASLSAVVNENTDLYVKWTPWAAGVIADANTLDFGLMNKGAAVFGSRATGNVHLEGTSYSMLGGSTSFAASAKACGDLGSSENAIKTGGSLSVSESKNGMILHASNSGKLALWVRSGSSGKSVVVSVLGPNELDLSTTDKFDGENPALAEINIPAAGDYYFGSTEGSLWIHHISFVADPEPSVMFNQSTGYNDEGTELVRYVFIVENIKADYWNSMKENMKVVLTGEGLGDGFDITELFTLTDSLTSKGEIYSAEVNGETYTFGVKNNTFYYVAVVAVSNAVS
ncbi:MAG: InlB B-repeat-containing protein, partial [Anaeroplasmataceae bacterium]|nr:InlB B-repeat-containing protein [Anaeroplasmataceae bacterium]